MAPSNSSLGPYYFFRVGSGARRHIFRADPVIDAINGLRPRTDLHFCAVCFSKRMSLNEMEAEIRHPCIVGDCHSLAVYQAPDVVQELGAFLHSLKYNPAISPPAFFVVPAQPVTVSAAVVVNPQAPTASSYIKAVNAARMEAAYGTGRPGCECGAHKVYGTGRGGAGHSNWCPWSRP